MDDVRDQEQCGGMTRSFTVLEDLVSVGIECSIIKILRTGMEVYLGGLCKDALAA